MSKLLLGVFLVGLVGGVAVVQVAEAYLQPPQLRPRDSNYQDNSPDGRHVDGSRLARHSENSANFRLTPLS